MTQAEKSWTGSVQDGSEINIDRIFDKLTQAFNSSPFFQHAGMQMRVVDGQIEAYIDMQDFMIGNVAYQILHGGVAATILDSIGGITAMGELYKKATLDDIDEVGKKSITLSHRGYAGRLFSTGAWSILYSTGGNSTFRT